MTMRGYVATRNGTFGVVQRSYITEEGEPMLIIRSGPLRWITPARERDTRQLNSCYEAEARAEASAWLDALKEVEK